MKALSRAVFITAATCGLVFAGFLASAASADITGTWDLTIHYKGGDARSTYVLKQGGEKVTGSYSGLGGPATVTGTVRSTDVVLSVTVKNSGGDPITARFSGKLVSSTRMAGTVTFAVDSSLPTEGADSAQKWSASKR